MKIVRSTELKWEGNIDHGKYQQQRKELGGGPRMSCGLWQLPPGKKSFPLHLHHGTEEALFAVSGRAKVRTPEGETPIGAGDFVSFPPGDVAHQLINDGAEPFVYVAMSASIGLDVVEYPETGKVACATGPRPAGKRFIFKTKDQTDYWADED